MLSLNECVEESTVQGDGRTREVKSIKKNLPVTPDKLMIEELIKKSQSENLECQNIER